VTDVAPGITVVDVIDIMAPVNATTSSTRLSSAKSQPWPVVRDLFRCAVEGPYVPGIGMQFGAQRPEAPLASRCGDVC
jgi:hypothetical protein